MALPYRPIRAAPVKKGTTPLGPLTERAVSKRSAIIKSACLECRKRKAKCNGQKPVCASCSKHDRKCVYDSDIRELRVRGLQQANQKLQDELAAAKLLMRQMASGSDQLRGAVSELLEEEKQPSEISELLKSDGTTNLRTDEVDDSRLSSRLNDPILGEVENGTSHSFPVDDLESFSADSSSMKQEESSPDSDSCIAIESASGNTYTTNLSTISTPSYTSTEMLIDYTQPNTPSLLDSAKGMPLYPSQLSYSQSAIISTNNSLPNELPSLVHQQGYDFTCFASMNVFWSMMRWMIDPSPETYAAMPEWIRPTANQLFTPHISMADFVLWPAFRDLVVQFPQLQERMAWLADMSMYIRCEWPYALEDALKPDPINGTVDLVDLAKEHVWNLGCWSVGPSFRKFVMNADAYLQIRNT
ncbi:hypothetical protein H9Q69_002876 [Fusarium xylarioides]|nr:hypothetical protein H9Q73_004375 [Fusarium xylarioides]KAG5798132.1 hypothetical protein H9Q69_002876 [Fusarium xylarioides]